MLQKPEAKECDKICREFLGCIGYTLFEGAHDSIPKDNKIDCKFLVKNGAKVVKPGKGVEACVKIAKQIGKKGVNINILNTNDHTEIGAYTILLSFFI